VRLPDPAGPAAKPLVDRRIAWLLATNRIYARDTSVSRRTTFVELLRARGHTVDQSRISRWEAGITPVSREVIHSYEEILGVPAWTLVAVAQGLRASFEAEPGEPAPLTRSTDQPGGELDEIFDRVEGRRATGSDWFELATALTGFDWVYLHPESWAEVAGLLVSELCRSSRLAYVLRYEALRTLVRHPAARRHTVKAIGAFVMDPAVQVVAQPLTLLQEVVDDQASELVIRLLGSEPGALSRGATWVAATKLARHQFSERDVERIEQLAVRLLSSDATPDHDYDAIDLACQLPGRSFARVRDSVGKTSVRRLLDLARQTSEIAGDDVARRLCRRLAAKAQSRLVPIQQHEPDAMLEAMIREALFHTHKERRHHAATLLAASPYRDGLATLCLEAADKQGETVAARLLTLSLYLGSGESGSRLRRFARGSAGAAVQSRALLALGLLDDPLDLDELPDVLHQARTASTPGVQYAAMFALGMNAAHALDDLSTSERLWERTAARWWLAVGPAVRDLRAPAADGASRQVTHAPLT
jgi:hypothetical protein